MIGDNEHADAREAGFVEVHFALGVGSLLGGGVVHGHEALVIICECAEARRELLRTRHVLL